MTNQEASAARASTKIHRKEVFIMFSMLMLIGCLVFYKFIIGSAVYLFKDIGSDTLNTFYPAFINIAETIWRGELPGWSFEQGLGQNVFPFSLSDPTTYPLYLLGSENLAFGIIWGELFKIICCGLLFFCFLKKLTVDTRAAYMGGLLYAFSGFMIIGSGWYIFSTLGLYVALTLLSFEMLYLEKKWWLFPISVALLAALNVVSLYTCSLFLFLYVLFRVFGDEAVDFKRFPQLLIRMLLLGGLGILISSAFALPNLMQMIDSPRVSGGASHTNMLAATPVLELGSASYLLTLLMRTFSSDLLGNGNSYTGWGNYLEAPLSYCGLITLLLIPQLFSFLKTWQRVIYGAFLGIFIFAEIFPWFRKGFWLFQGDYFRDFSLYLAIIFILFSVFALDKIIKNGKANLLVLGASLSVLLIALYFPYGINVYNGYGLKSVIDSVTQRNVTLFIIMLTFSLTLFSVNKFRQYAPVFLIVMVIAELSSFSENTVNKRDALSKVELNKKTGYNDYSNEAIAFIKQQDSSFYRIEKNYGSTPAMHGSLNDSKVQHYFGSSSYHSFNQLNYINFLSTCDVLDAKNEDETRWSAGVKSTPLLQVLMGVRYFLFMGDWESFPTLADKYAVLGKFGNVTVLKSKFAIPMGVAYDTYMTQSDFNRLDATRKRVALLKAIMIPDTLAADVSAMRKISVDEIPVFANGVDELTIEIGADADKLKSSSLHIDSFSNNHIDGKISTQIKQLVFFSFPFDRGWSVQVNGKDSDMLMVNGGLSAVLVEPGENSMSLRYFPPYIKTGLYLTLLGLFIFLGLLFRSRKFTDQGSFALKS
jgi:uncharacterized membrane protein YfhO